MGVRFLLDEDLNPAVAEIARRRGLDVVSVHEIDRRGFSNRDQLAYAAAEERVLVTGNRDDFILLSVSLFQSGGPHHGILIVPCSLPNRDPERIARAIAGWAKGPAGRGGSTAYLVDFLPS